MWKSLKPATAVALALGLGACTSMEGPFSIMPGSGESSKRSILPDKADISNEMHLADASMSAGDPATAISIYRRLAREYPFSIRPRIALGNALLASNAPQEAERAFEGALKLKGNDYQALAGQGRVELALHQPAEALSYFDKAARAKPDDTEAQNGRAVSLDQLGRHDEAQAIYLDLLSHDPSNAHVRNNYALSLALAGKYDDSTDILAGLAAAPDSGTRIRQNLSLVYGLAGNDGQAAHVARMDLDEEAVANNLQYFQRLRHVESPIAKGAALLKPSNEPFKPVPPQMTQPATADASPEPVHVSNVEPAPARVQKSASTAPVETREVAELPATPVNDQPTDKKHAFNFFGSGHHAATTTTTTTVYNSTSARAEPKAAPVLAPSQAQGTTQSVESVLNEDLKPKAPSPELPDVKIAQPAHGAASAQTLYPTAFKHARSAAVPAVSQASADAPLPPAPESVTSAKPAAEASPANDTKAEALQSPRSDDVTGATSTPTRAPAVPPGASRASAGEGISASIRRPVHRTARHPAVPVASNAARAIYADEGHQPAVPPQG